MATKLPMFVHITDLTYLKMIRNLKMTLTMLNLLILDKEHI